MATPITHLYWGQRVLAQGVIRQSPKLFLVGTSFPDCRYPAKLPRKLTHQGGESLVGINDFEPFRAGMVFHHWLDKKRHYGMWLELIKKGCPDDNDFNLALKLWEDTHFYSEIKSIEQYFPYFERVYPQQLEFVDEITVKLWHKTLLDYFHHSPTLILIRQFLTKTGMDREKREAILAWYKKIGLDQRLQQSVISFYDQLKFD